MDRTWTGPTPITYEKFERLMAFPVTIQDEELRRDIQQFELVEQITEAHIARLLELACDAVKGRKADGGTHGTIPTHDAESVRL